MYPDRNIDLFCRDFPYERAYARRFTGFPNGAENRKNRAQAASYEIVYSHIDNISANLSILPS